MDIEQALKFADTTDPTHAALQALAAEVRRLRMIAPELADRELDAIFDLAKEKDMSPAAVIRQALRVYQSEHIRATRGEPDDTPPGCGQLD